MPTDEERWKEVMIESGQMPDDNGIWHYNQQAIENPYEWKRTRLKSPDNLRIVG